MSMSGLTVKATLYSVLLHLGLFGLLAVNINSKPKLITPPPKSNINIVDAVTVDNKDVEKELKRLQEIDNEKLRKQQEAEKKLKALEKKASDLEKQRKDEEKRLAEAKQKQAEEKKKREAEEQRVAKLKKEKEELEKQRKIEEENKRKAEEERQRLVAEERSRQEQERLRKEQEAELQKQLAEEQRMLEAAQAKQDQQLLRSIVSNIYNRVVANFNTTGLPAGLECVFTIRLLPGGEIISSRLAQSSGNEIFDNRAQVALQKASPLPVPQDSATLERLGLREFNFRFKP